MATSGTIERDRTTGRNGYQQQQHHQQDEVRPAGPWIGADDTDNRAECAETNDGRVIVRSSYRHDQNVILTRDQFRALLRAGNDDPRMRDLARA